MVILNFSGQDLRKVAGNFKNMKEQALNKGNRLQ